jgi:hypothetical protein
MAAFYRHMSVAAATALLAVAAGSSLAADADDHTAYVRTDLLSNTQVQAQAPDPNLQNSWGVANSPGGPLWVSTTMMVSPRSMTAMA